MNRLREPDVSLIRACWRDFVDLAEVHEAGAHHREDLLEVFEPWDALAACRPDLALQGSGRPSSVRTSAMTLSSTPSTFRSHWAEMIGRLIALRTDSTCASARTR